MPQDELFATSARLIGYEIRLGFCETGDRDDVLVIRPHFSKRPQDARDFRVGLSIPTYARSFVPGLIKVAHDEMTGGLCSNVPGVVRANLLAVREGFRQGALH